MNRHQRALRLVADARPAVLDDPTERPVPRFAEPPLSQPRSRRRLLLAALMPTVAAAVVAGVLIVSTLDKDAPPGAEPTEQARPATAQNLLLAAAEKAEKAEQAEKVETTSGAFWVTKVEQRHVYDVGDYSVVGRTEVETWRPLRGGNTVLVSRSLGAAPATDTDRAAWKAAGSPTTWTVPLPEGKPARTVDSAPGKRKVAAVPGTGFELAGRNLTYTELQALPTDPEALKRFLTNAEVDPEPQADLLFLHSRSLLTDLPVPPGVRAATYRMLAGLQGLTLGENVRDAQGRPGAAIGCTIRNAGGGALELKMIIDVRSGSLLATEERTGGTLLLEQRFTDDQPPRS